MFSLLLALFLVSSPGQAAPVRKCWQCVAGTSYYDVPVHGYPSSTREGLEKESLRVCRIIIKSWRKNPAECALKRCAQTACVVDDPSDDEPSRGPWCNSNDSCGLGSLCIGGKCVRKDDPFDNKCSSDSDCGGTFGGHGTCRLGRCQ